MAPEDNEQQVVPVDDPQPGYTRVDTSINQEEDILEMEEEYYYTVDFNTKDQVRYVTKEEYDRFIEKEKESERVKCVNDIFEQMIGDDTDTDDVMTNGIRGIFGVPYQFSDLVDPITDTENMMGRKYSEKILSVMPVIFFTPGEPKFMGKGNKELKNQLAGAIMEKLADKSDDFEFDENGRYYTFMQNFNEYRLYANTALRALAYYMGIDDVKVPVPGAKPNEFKSLGRLDITDYMNNGFTKLFGTDCVLPFYLDAETAISEDFSNDTAESMISQTANGFSQTAREVQFILGSKDKGGLSKALQEVATGAGEAVLDVAGSLSDIFVGHNLLSRITNELSTVVSGGKIVFPEIWSGSSYSKSYNINIKLRSPDPDPVSIFLNVYMPLVLLISLTAPRQLNGSPNAYSSPFLVRATYKSIFNCDLGIISSLSITKGGNDRWNVLGQPYIADVSISLKDLYSDMFVSKSLGLICNTAQMDYLATMAGVDLNTYEPARLAQMAGILLQNVPVDMARQGWGGIKTFFARKVAGLLSNFSDVRSLGW